MFNYSIIIPHKNLPVLLKRCLDSIPEREDVQVIIVDDNSDSAVVDFNEFPGLGRNNVQVVFDKSGLGAGHARNVGMEQASGKWLVFADCDDFFNKEELCAQMNLFADDDVTDLVFFDFSYINSETLSLAAKPHSLNKLFDLIEQHNDDNYLRYRWHAPWGKFVKSSLVWQNKISFQESRWSNDVGFSTDVAIAANSIKCVRSKIYNYTYREGSLIKAKSLDAYLCRLQIAINNENKLIKNGLSKYRAKHIEFWHYKLFSVSILTYMSYVPRVVKIIGLMGYIRGVVSNSKGMFKG